MTPQNVIAATRDDVGSVGAAFYFHEATLARGKELGLDGFRFYFLGRGGVLGDVEAPVITSAFGYFHPDLVARMWDSARQRMAPREAARHYVECCRELGRRVLGQVEGLDRFAAAAEAVLAATHPAGLALYAGWAAEPRPDDDPGRAMQLVATLRELRGSVHLLAVVATGLDPAVAHAIRRPDDVATFGYPDGVPVTDDDRALLVDADALTDRLLLRSYAALSEAQREDLASGVRAIAAAVGG
jgi:hypothetical protein